MKELLANYDIDGDPIITFKHDWNLQLSFVDKLKAFTVC